MKPVGLAFDDIPPLRVPLRFFLTAPLFGVLAGGWWIAEGGMAFSSRWMNGALAATHLFTLGFMAMVMIGSLFQVVPVLGGGSIPQARRIAPVVHAALTAGTLCLAIALARFSPPWFAAALVGLGTAFGVFVPLLGWRVLRLARGDAMFTIRLAVLSLLVTLVLGIGMVIDVVWPGSGIPYRVWTDAHASFGLGGWVLLLIMGVSYQVVPMFHVTPSFDTRLVRGVGLAVFGGLVALGVTSEPAVTIPAASLVALGGLIYVFAASRLLSKRRRRRAEPAVRAWQSAHGFLAVSLVLGWKTVCLPGTRIPGIEQHQEALLLGVLFGLGFAVTVILGMLGKIVPFLSFTHLQRRCLLNLAAFPLLPTMNEIVTDRSAWWQLSVHLTTCAGVALAVVVPALWSVAGALVCADFALCERNMIVAALRYGRASRAIAEVDPAASTPPT